MAILVEGISVVIKADALLRAFDSNFGDFKEIVPNGTLCADGELARVGFMAPLDAESFVEALQARSVKFIVDGEAKDLSVVDQQSGPTVRTPWLEFGHIEWQGDPDKRVPCCRLAGSTLKQIVTPDGWKYEGSLTSSYLFVPEDSVSRLEEVATEDGVEEFRTPLSQHRFFIGRTGKRKGR